MTNRRAAARAGSDTPTDQTPWWRVPMVWLVMSGPAIVVVAAIATAVVAYRGADVVVTEPAMQSSKAVRPTGDTPAMLARNHAATAAADR